jgi:hypothetical protein
MTICSIKKRKTFFTQTLFSEWIKEMSHYSCMSCLDNRAKCVNQKYTHLVLTMSKIFTGLTMVLLLLAFLHYYRPRTSDERTNHAAVHIRKW